MVKLNQKRWTFYFQGTGELPFEPEFASVYADIELMVEGHKFYCHKVGSWKICEVHEYTILRIFDLVSYQSWLYLF